MTLMIGLTGYMGSGKGEIVKLLKLKDFKYISLSDLVRAEAAKRKIARTRGNLQNLGNELRKKFGMRVLGQKVREKIEKESTRRGKAVKQNWVIDGIRHPAEIAELRKLKDFYLIGVTARPETLMKRIIGRGRKSDVRLEKDILEKIKREIGQGEPEEGQQVKKCLDLADFLIINEGTLKELKKKFDHFWGLLQGTERPTFDEIFMEIANVWAQRSTCLRRKVGAVIAKDKQQLTTGYNGAPRGLKHCAELGGCLREKLKVPHGQRHELCRGTHAEQNAITQAAKFGINIEGSTLYCNTHPCTICVKMVINAGISKIVYDGDYDDELAKQILGEQKIVELVRYEGKKYRIN